MKNASQPSLLPGFGPISNTPRRLAQEERRQLQRDLAGIGDGKGLVLHFQTRRWLRDGDAGAAEAQLRWVHRRLGTSPAAVFLPMAAQAGLLTKVGGWSLTAACVAAAGWPGGAVSVSIAACQIREDALLDQVAESLVCSGLPAARLELLIPEGALADIDSPLLLTLSAIRDLGVGVALGEFGAQTGGIALLRRLPLTALKLSRVLLRGVPTDPDDAALLRIAIAAGQAMGLMVVADGVETEAQLAFLVSCGCDQVQGDMVAVQQASLLAGHATVRLTARAAA
jgi:EAL domain-containing protein (putative c-di-GMP-specific phosphodiesterase class I)